MLRNGTQRGHTGAREVAVIDGNTFIVSDTLGDIIGGTVHGFFAADTRFLSHYVLRINGERPLLLSFGNVEHDAASFYAVNRAAPGLPAGCLSVIRDRFIGTGLHEDITLVNQSGQELDLTVEIELGSDFADIFEVRGATGGHGGRLAKPGRVSVVHADGYDLTFVYRRAEYERRTLIRCSPAGATDDTTIGFQVHLAQKERWRVCIGIDAAVHGAPAPMPCRAARFDLAMILGPADEVAASEPPSLLHDNWQRLVPQMDTMHLPLQLAYDRAITDLDALRLTETGHGLPAAGLPWFMAIFGRDSLITGYQTLLIGPDLAKGALRVLASYQARRVDDFRDEQPGKMPHEIRHGELSHLGEVPHSRYYGTVDATALWLILLSETYRWTGDLDLVSELLPNAEGALAWIDRYGDVDGDGFVEYESRSTRGLRNQCWKDSGDSMRFRDGRLAEGAIASVEVQGYVYDAKLRMADLYEELGQPERAAELYVQAGALKKAFNEAFWMPEEGFYALALDGRKRRVDSVTSNPGHCLWSGIVDEGKASLVVERLLADDMFAGWGVRTMSSYMHAYNPISYHNGSIWPHDNSLIAAGLWRYGFREAAGRIIDGVLTASYQFEANRLPELFAGYRRRRQSFTVSYPDANAPQAWAAGAVILMLQTLLGVEVRDRALVGQPLPGMPDLRLTGVPVLGQRVDLAVAHRDGGATLLVEEARAAEKVVC